MNEWAKHYGYESARVYRREFERALNYSTTWFGKKMKDGVIPRPHVDPGGRRGWWTRHEFLETMARLNVSAGAPTE